MHTIIKFTKPISTTNDIGFGCYDHFSMAIKYKKAKKTT